MSGERPLRKYADALFALRIRTGQSGNPTTDPVLFAVSSTEAKRRPVAILMKRGEELLGAVLLREQMRYGIALRYFYACDAAGDEFVIAPPLERERCLLSCLETFGRRVPGGVISLATQAKYRMFGAGQLSSAGEGVAQYRVRLSETMDRTLAQFGSHTRRNLRYYPRNLLKRGCTFHPDLTAKQGAEASEQLVAYAEFGMTPRLMEAQREGLARTTGSFAMGIQSETGEWLSYVAGWRQHGQTSVFSQMNHGGHKGDSLSVAMRGLLLEHEVERKQEYLAFVSYTNKFFERMCQEDVRYDLLIAHKGWRLRALMFMVPKLLKPEHRLRQLLTMQG